jgi:hypothetical protein
VYGTHACNGLKRAYHFGYKELCKFRKSHHIYLHDVQVRIEDGIHYIGGDVCDNLELISILQFLSIFQVQFLQGFVFIIRLLPQFCQAQVDVN